MYSLNDGFVYGQIMNDINRSPKSKIESKIEKKVSFDGNDASGYSIYIISNPRNEHEESLEYWFDEKGDLWESDGWITKVIMKGK